MLCLKKAKNSIFTTKLKIADAKNCQHEKTVLFDLLCCAKSNATNLATLFRHKQNVNFFNFLTSRWFCAETVQAPSGHTSNDRDQAFITTHQSTAELKPHVHFCMLFIEFVDALHGLSKITSWSAINLA